MLRKLTIAGTAAYALVVGVLGVQGVMIVRRNGQFADVSGWGVGCLLAIVVLSAALIAAGAVTRRGLVARGGPWIFRNGWRVLVGLTAANLLVSLLPSGAGVAWVAGPAVFLPHFVRKLEDAYYDGVAEAEQQLMAAKPGGAPAPRR
ncbi:hypothetical protein [Kribbella sp. NPDC055071]